MADITFGTNNEYGFDYLRDNMASSPEGPRAAQAPLRHRRRGRLGADRRRPDAAYHFGPRTKRRDQLVRAVPPGHRNPLTTRRRTLVTSLLAEARQLIAEGKNDEGRREALPRAQGSAQIQAADQVPLRARREGADAEDRKRLHGRQQPPHARDHGRTLLRHRRETQPVELTDKGHEALSKYFNEDGFFVLPDIGAEVAELERATSRPRRRRRSAMPSSTTTRSSRSASTRCTSF